MRQTARGDPRPHHSLSCQRQQLTLYIHNLSDNPMKTAGVKMCPQHWKGGSGGLTLVPK